MLLAQSNHFSNAKFILSQKLPYILALFIRHIPMSNSFYGVKMLPTQAESKRHKELSLPKIVRSIS